MKTIIEAPNDGVLSLGRQGENLARRIAFKLPQNWDMSDPAASVQLVARRAGESAAYPVMLTREDGVYYWDVTATDTGRDGYGLCELRYMIGDVLAKSMTWLTNVAKSISDDLTEPPDAAQNYLSQVMAEGAKAAEAADRAESAVLKMPYIENGVWMVWDFEQQAYVNTGVSAGGGGGEGSPGAVFVPHVDADGNLSWTNNGGLDNPETVNIMGPQGPQGEKGDTGAQGPQGIPGSNGKNAYQYAQDGGYTGSETEFAAKLAAEHLPAPATAAVGQYFKAKTVDGNGLVTEVEAVDAPTGGGHWETVLETTWDVPVVTPTAYDAGTGIFTCAEGELDALELNTEYVFFQKCNEENVAYNTILNTDNVLLTKLSDTTFSINVTPGETFVATNVKFSKGACLVVKDIDAKKIRLTLDGQFKATATLYDYPFFGAGVSYFGKNVGYQQIRSSYQAYQQVTAEVESPYRIVGEILCGFNAPSNSNGFHFKNNSFCCPLVPTYKQNTIVFSSDGQKIKNLYSTSAPTHLGGIYNNAGISNDFLKIISGTKVKLERWVE